MFQSTRPRGARLSLLTIVVFMDMFQSTRPRGARPIFWQFDYDGKLSFNPRAHVGRDTRPKPGRKGTRCFNPRAHVGRDL